MITAPTDPELRPNKRLVEDELANWLAEAIARRHVQRTMDMVLASF